MADSFSNCILNNFPDTGYSVVSADFSSFQGPISEFTFIVWLAPSTSGYVAYFGTPDATERYFAVYYDNSDNQLIVTLKKSGLSGLRAQICIIFQLQSSISDGSFHLIMIHYVERNLVCVVDGVPVNSVAVVYKERSLIGEVYGLPLNTDIEGRPVDASAATLVLGARPVTGGYDNNIGARLSTALIFASRVPSMFSDCILACLESMEVVTAGTAVMALGFDVYVSNRRLVLNGPTSPQEVQTIFRSLLYTNKAPNINVISFRLEVFDGIATSADEVYVEQGIFSGHRRRRRSVAVSSPSDINANNEQVPMKYT